MRRRLLVAKALVHRPPVVVLDEPTAGVDVELRRSLWRYMRELNAKGVTVVLTTHYLEEAEQMCDRIAIIDRGRVVAVDDKEALLRRLDEKELVLTLDPVPSAVPEALAGLDCSIGPTGRLTVRYRPSAVEVGRILDAVRAEGLAVRDLQTREADLEDIFLRLTGSGAPGEEGPPPATASLTDAADALYEGPPRRP
jgi:ABC-2 type transport system ATP-binding protein